MAQNAKVPVSGARGAATDKAIGGPAPTTSSASCSSGRAQRLGFTLAETRHILEMSSRGKTPCPTVRAIVQKRIADNAANLTELQALQERMTKARRRWRRMRDGVPDGNAICRLIEVVSEKLG